MLATTSLEIDHVSRSIEMDRVTELFSLLGSDTRNETGVCSGNFTYHGLHFLSVSFVVKTPVPKSHWQTVPAGTTVEKFT